MFKKDNDNFDYEIVDNFDHIIEEKGNKFISLRKISWNGRDPKIDIRSYFSNDTGEVMGKGVGLTEEGADTLTETLVKTGFGDTREILVSIMNRDNFEDSLTNSINDVKTYYDTDALLNLINGDSVDDIE